MNKTAIITGGARGIGRACALELARKGFNIALVDLLRLEMERTAGEITALGSKVMIEEADVSDFSRAHEIVDEIHKDFGRVDFLLNNAGNSNAKSIFDITEDEFDKTIEVNLKSCFNYIHAVAPIMKAQGGGRIVSMSSLNALSGGVTGAISKHSYAAAKAGILGLTRSLAKELGPTIIVNAICPGLIKTELLSKGIASSREPELVKGIALGRFGCPDDVAQLVGFLASSEPLFITGQEFVVDGFQFNV